MSQFATSSWDFVAGARTRRAYFTWFGSTCELCESLLTRDNRDISNAILTVHLVSFFFFLFFFQKIIRACCNLDSMPMIKITGIFYLSMLQELSQFLFLSHVYKKKRKDQYLLLENSFSIILFPYIEGIVSICFRVIYLYFKNFYNFVSFIFIKKKSISNIENPFTYYISPISSH